MSTSFMLSPFFYTMMLLDIVVFMNSIPEFMVGNKQTLIRLHKLNLETPNHQKKTFCKLENTIFCFLNH